MIFICLTIVDLPLSPEPIPGQHLVVSPRYYRSRAKSEPQNTIPNSKILHSLRSLLSSSNSLASIWRLLFFFSSSTPSCILWQAPIVRCEDRRTCSRDRFAHQLAALDSSNPPTASFCRRSAIVDPGFLQRANHPAWAKDGDQY